MQNKLLLCLRNIIVVPFLHKGFPLINDHWLHHGPICTDSNHRGHVLSICPPLFMLSLCSSSSNHPHFALVCRRKPTFIHPINILWFDPQLHHKLLNNIKPRFDCDRIQGFSMLHVKWFAPVSLKNVVMMIQETENHDFPTVSSALALACRIAFANCSISLHANGNPWLADSRISCTSIVSSATVSNCFPTLN